MDNPDIDLIFPPHIVPALHDLCGTACTDVANFVIVIAPDSLEQMAFFLMTLRMNNYAICNAEVERYLQ